MEVGKYYQHKTLKDLIVKCINYKINNFEFSGEIITLKKENYLFYDIGTIDFFNVDKFIEYEGSIPEPMQEPTTDQIGGIHYKKLKIQPTEFIHANNLSFIEGNIIKYVVRHKDKNGIEDLKKAKHYIDLLIKFEYEDPKKF
jgi:hypothetical protein